MGKSKDGTNDPEMEGIPTCFEDLTVSEYGLDQSDILLIRERLAMTPTERLLAAQDLMTRVLRVRSRNG